MGSTPEKRTMFLTIMQKSFDVKSRTIDVIMSTNSVDREGDVIESHGLDFDSFLKNPVVLWAHDMNCPPIAKVIKVDVKPDRVEAVVQFAETPFAKEVFGLYADGFLNAWSLGFIPKRIDSIQPDDANPGGYAYAGGYHILDAEVVELSAVPVPANAEALMKALKKTSPETRKAFAKLAAMEQPEVQTVAFKADAIKLPEEAFRKTISDRAKGKFPVVFEPVGKNGAEVIIEYEDVRKDGDRLSEAKLLSVKLAVLEPATEAPEDSGRTVLDEAADADDTRPLVGIPDSHRMELDVAEARASLALCDAEIFELGI